MHTGTGMQGMMSWSGMRNTLSYSVYPDPSQSSASRRVDLIHLATALHWYVTHLASAEIKSCPFFNRNMNIDMNIVY